MKTMRSIAWTIFAGLLGGATLAAGENAVVDAPAVSETRRTSRIAPSSTLSQEQAALAATQMKQTIPGSNVFAVRPTGSMRPLFDGNCLLLAEPAPYESLQVGDIVVFRNSRSGARVVHRILERRRGGFWTKGDHNGSMDNELVTSKNYVGRIFGIIYTQRAENQITPDAVAAIRTVAATP